MKNLILSATLALSSVVAPAAAHACDPSEVSRVQAQPVFAPQYAPRFMPQNAPRFVRPAFVPRVAPPVYAPPVYVQPNGYGHRDDRGERHGRRFEARRDERPGQWSRGHDDWRR